MITLQGKSVYRDICEGNLVFLRKVDMETSRYLVKNREAEIERFEMAILEAKKQLKDIYIKTEKAIGSANAAIFEIHEMMLEDPEYCDSIKNLIMTQYVNLEYAIQQTSDNFNKMFLSMDDSYMKERATDIIDISKRLLTILSGEKNQIQISEPCIIAAEDLVPSETVQLPMKYVLGFCLQKGSLHSHTAILARSMGIPAIVDMGNELSEEFDGEVAIIDGYTGNLYVNPNKITLQSMREKEEQSERHKANLLSLKGKASVTVDGKAIKLFANASTLEDIKKAVINDAGGIGLFRSEMLYLEKQTAPTEEEQFEIYRNILCTMQEKEVIIRTLDIGADKQVNYLNLPKEDNPALGCRAIRLCLANKELFKTQLRALYRASIYGKLLIMYPMITSCEEITQIRLLESEVKKELDQQNIPYSEKILTGIMIETPAAALISDELAVLVDFFSIGTNDLIQYTLAADRQNPNLDKFYTSNHKAVMRLIKMTTKNAHKAGIWVGICGELAADTTLTEEFIRIGIDELSVSPSIILSVRHKIREIDLRK